MRLGETWKPCLICESGKVYRTLVKYRVYDKIMILQDGHEHKLIPKFYVADKCDRCIWEVSVPANEHEKQLIQDIQDKMANKFSCKMCGKCCTNVKTTKVNQDDIDRWEKQDRLDILEWTQDGVMWTDRDTRKLVTGDCPFLKMRDGKSLCEIHKTKPTLCKEFVPTVEYAIEFGCKGYNK